MLKSIALAPEIQSGQGKRKGVIIRHFPGGASMRYHAPPLPALSPVILASLRWRIWFHLRFRFHPASLFPVNVNLS
jgi:hypothetical protein